MWKCCLSQYITNWLSSKLSNISILMDHEFKVHFIEVRQVFFDILTKVLNSEWYQCKYFVKKLDFLHVNDWNRSRHDALNEFLINISPEIFYKGYYQIQNWYLYRSDVDLFCVSQELEQHADQCVFVVNK